MSVPTVGGDGSSIIRSLVGRARRRLPFLGANGRTDDSEDALVVPAEPIPGVGAPNLENGGQQPSRRFTIVTMFGVALITAVGTALGPSLSDMLGLHHTEFNCVEARSEAIALVKAEPETADIKYTNEQQKQCDLNDVVTAVSDAHKPKGK